jgi:hypothetical protein
MNDKDRTIAELRNALRMAIDYLRNKHEADQIHIENLLGVLQRSEPDQDCHPANPLTSFRFKRKLSVEQIPGFEDDRFEDQRHDPPADADEPRDPDPDDEIPF